jgi:hypothetical protein
VFNKIYEVAEKKIQEEVELKLPKNYETQKKGK